MAKLSIIVPVYKVEMYLDKCIQSILAQTFEDFELILVDDGSPDNCGVMCDDWAKKDERIIVIHKENGGLSSARNAGLDIVQGEYIGFVDSDDYISLGMYDFLLKSAEEHGAQISCCGFFDCYEGKLPKRRAQQFVKIMDSFEAIELALLGNVMTVNVCNKVYKKEIFKSIRFPVGKTMEDGYVIVDLLLKAEIVYVSTEPYYYYVSRVGSITNGKFSENDLCAIESSIYNYNLILKVCPQLEDIAVFRVLWSHRYIVERLSVQDKETQKKYDLLIKDSKSHIVTMFKKMLANKYISPVKKIAYMILAMSPSLYMCLFRLFVYILR